MRAARTRAVRANTTVHTTKALSMASDLTHEKPLSGGVKVGGMCVSRPVLPAWVAEQFGIRLGRMHYERHALERRPVLSQLDDRNRAADTIGVAWWKPVMRHRDPFAGLMHSAVTR